MKARIQNGLNAAANWFKRLKDGNHVPDVRKMVKAKEDVYNVVCLNGSYYPKKNGKFAVEYPGGKIGWETDPDDLIIGYPTNAQAMEFINALKEE